MTLEQIIIRARSPSRRPLHFRCKSDPAAGTFLFSDKGTLRYLNKSGRDSRVSLTLDDFTRTDWQIVQPPGDKPDGEEK